MLITTIWKDKISIQFSFLLLLFTNLVTRVRTLPYTNAGVNVRGFFYKNYIIASKKKNIKTENRNKNKNKKIK